MLGKQMVRQKKAAQRKISAFRLPTMAKTLK